MKIIFFCSYYSQYLDTFYKKNPQLYKCSYDDQLKALEKDHFGHWASYAEEFRKMGWDAQLIIPNCKPLQEAWAKENGFKPDNNWIYSIPIAQVRKFRPDIFYLSSMFEYYGEFLKSIKPYAKHIFGWINCELPKDLDLTNIELMLTSVPYFVDNFRKEGIKSEWLHSAFDPQILDLTGPAEKPDIDFSFIGSLTRAHRNRINIIKALIEHTPLQIFGTGVELIPDDRNIFKRLMSKNIYEKRTRPQVWGLEMYKTLQRSRITLNAHIDISREFIGNMRMYEATGMGTLLLTDGRNAPWKNFTDDEVVFYDSIDDAIEKANYYLVHEKERADIAKRGQLRTLTEYNYENTSRKLLSFFAQQIEERNLKVNS